MGKELKLCLPLSTPSYKPAGGLLFSWKWRSRQKFKCWKQHASKQLFIIQKRNKKGKSLWGNINVCIFSFCSLGHWPFSLSLSLNLQISRREESSLSCGWWNLVYIIHTLCVQRTEMSSYFSVRVLIYHSKCAWLWLTSCVTTWEIGVLGFMQTFCCCTRQNSYKRVEVLCYLDYFPPHTPFTGQRIC